LDKAAIFFDPSMNKFVVKDEENSISKIINKLIILNNDDIIEIGNNQF
jgi:hypothetical protein